MHRAASCTKDLTQRGGVGTLPLVPTAWYKEPLVRSLVLLLVLLLAGVAAAAVVRGTGPAVPASQRLLAVDRGTRRWRAGGLLLGVVAAAVSTGSGGLGRGVLLAAPLLAVFVLAGVVVGELRVTAPTGSTRTASLEVRRVRDYLPPRLGAAVLSATGVLTALLVATTAGGTADDLGRAGRWLARTCSAEQSVAVGPWPGSFYSAPLAVVVAAGLLVAALALHLVVRRPRQGEEAATDDALRRRACAAVTAATGLLVAVPLAGAGFFAAHALLRIGCRPGWWTALGWALLLLVPAAVGLAAWCAAVLLARPGSPVPAEQR